MRRVTARSVYWFRGHGLVQREVNPCRLVYLVFLRYEIPAFESVFVLLAKTEKHLFSMKCKVEENIK